MRRVGAALRVVAVQLLNSMSNFVLIVALAAVSSVTEFGDFAVAYGLYVVTSGIVLTVLAEPSIVIWARGEWQISLVDGVRNILLLSAALGILGSAALLVTYGYIFESLVLTSQVATFACFFPVAVCNDLLRPMALGVGATRPALIGGWVWLGAIVLGWLLSEWVEARATTLLAGAWGLGSLASLVVLMSGLRQGGRGVRTGDRSRRLRVGEVGRIGWPLGAEFLATAGLMTGAVWWLRASVGPDGSAALRGVQTVFGPVLTVLAAARYWLLGRSYTSKSASNSILVSVTVFGALAGGVVGGCVAIASLLIGPSLFQDVWPLIEPVLPMAVVYYSTVIAGFGIGTYLRSRTQSVLILVSRLASVPVVLASWMLWSGVTGALLSLALGSTVAVLWQLIGALPRARSMPVEQQ